MTGSQRRFIRITTTILTAALAAGVAAQGPGPHCAPSATASSAVAPLDMRVQAAVQEALLDERHTEDVYAAVIHAHGEVRPFSNAVQAEARHAGILERLLAARGIAVPPPAVAPAQPAPASVTQACAAAVVSERQNVALYDRLLAGGPLPEDVRQAFDHNRWASLEHHLPAFERCRGAAAAGGGE